MGQRWSLNSEETRKNFDAHVSSMLLAGKRVTVEFLPEKRSLDQNAMIRALYRQVAGQKEDESVLDIERHCKLHYGVPILREQDEQFRAMYDKAIKDVLSYEEKLQAMDILPVTSRMSTPQATEYIETVIREYSKQGLCLINPAEEGSYR